MKYKLIIAFIIQCLVGHCANAEDASSNKEYIYLESNHIGTKYILNGKYGSLGKRYTFVGIIYKSNNKKSPGIYCTIHQINGNYVKPLDWEIPEMSIFPEGSIIEFEAREMGRIVIIDPLSNPTTENAGNAGLQVYISLDKVLSLNKIQIQNPNNGVPVGSVVDDVKNPFDK